MNGRNTLLERIKRPYNSLLKHQFDPHSLPLEIALKDGDKMWVGKREPIDIKKYKVWWYQDIAEGYECILEEGAN